METVTQTDTFIKKTGKTKRPKLVVVFGFNSLTSHKAFLYNILSGVKLVYEVQLILQIELSTIK